LQLPPQKASAKGKHTTDQSQKDEGFNSIKIDSIKQSVQLYLAISIFFNKDKYTCLFSHNREYVLIIFDHSNSQCAQDISSPQELIIV
jgi:hypothetical protein